MLHNVNLEASLIAVICLLEILSSVDSFYEVQLQFRRNEWQANFKNYRLGLHFTSQVDSFVF